jgi:membrane fusion protein, multidrug efflux system
MTNAINKTDADVRPFPVNRNGEEPRTSEGAIPEVKAETESAVKSGSRRRMVLGIVALAAFGAVGWYGYKWWTVDRFFVSTDDAYVTANITTLSPKVTGYIKSLAVTENTQVKKGDPLFVIDDGDYKIAVELARSQLAVQQKTLLRITAQADAARASVKEAEASKAAAVSALENAKLTMDRAEKLRESSTAPQATLDDASAAYDQAVAGLAGADAKIAAANANIAVYEAQYAEAESSVKTLELQKEKAERDLSFTVLRAPSDGVVGNVSTEVGNLVSPGQSLGSLVPLADVYIEANFKETDLSRIGIGSKVNIKIDAVGTKEYEGTVTSLSPATGSVFSLLPPENATGNFTKVVQRLPVRVAIGEELLKTGKLHAGLSADVSVDSRTGTQNNQ